MPIAMSIVLSIYLSSYLPRSAASTGSMQEGHVKDLK